MTPEEFILFIEGFVAGMSGKPPTKWTRTDLVRFANQVRNKVLDVKRDKVPLIHGDLSDVVNFKPGVPR